MRERRAEAAAHQGQQKQALQARAAAAAAGCCRHVRQQRVRHVPRIKAGLACMFVGHLVTILHNSRHKANYPCREPIRQHALVLETLPTHSPNRIRQPITHTRAIDRCMHTHGRGRHEHVAHGWRGGKTNWRSSWVLSRRPCAQEDRQGRRQKTRCGSRHPHPHFTLGTGMMRQTGQCIQCACAITHIAQHRGARRRLNNACRLQRDHMPSGRTNHGSSQQASHGSAWRAHHSTRSGVNE